MFGAGKGKGDKESDPSKLRCRSAIQWRKDPSGRAGSPRSNGASQSVAGRASPSPTARVLVKGEIVSEGGKLTAKRKTTLRSGAAAKRSSNSGFAFEKVKTAKAARGNNK